ncbi:MAG: response regulator [Deltaproteobacteria bacterium]|nr:response regulator [Deltaproteobacteria bacterium]
MEDKYTILIVDDEENILKSLKRLLHMDGYRVLTALTCDEGYKILNENEVQLIISDQRMPKSSGTEFLSKVKEDFPDIIRTIISGFTDVNTITESINKGHIYKFFFKPWNDNNLRLEIKQCLKQYELIKKNRELNEIVSKKNKDLELINAELKRINDNLEAIVEKRTKDLEIQNQALELSRAIFDDIPLPVLGISSDGMVVLCNKKASDIAPDNIYFETGRNISDYLPESAKKIFDNSLNCEEPASIDSCSIMGKDYKILIKPLSGRFKGKGATVIII